MEDRKTKWALEERESLRKRWDGRILGSWEQNSYLELSGGTRGK